MRVLINLVGFQAGWFACVLGAAKEMPWLGPAVVAMILALHLLLVSDRTGELTLLGFAAVLGHLADSALAWAGVVEFPASERHTGRAPFWMAAMWMNFAAVLNVSLRWMEGRYLLAALLGATGGPLAYFAGARLGAIQLAPLAVSLPAVGAEWALATPALFAFASWVRATPGNRARHGRSTQPKEMNS